MKIRAARIQSSRSRDGFSLLEIIVALVQAYVFTLITAVLIGMMQHEH